MRKVGFVLGGAVGFVLGSRSGRKPYESLEGKARELAGHPRVREVKKKAGQVADKASDKAHTAAEKAKEKVGEAADTADEKAQAAGDRA